MATDSNLIQNFDFLFFEYILGEGNVKIVAKLSQILFFQELLGPKWLILSVYSLINTNNAKREYIFI